MLVQQSQTDELRLTSVIVVVLVMWIVVVWKVGVPSISVLIMLVIS